jgi:hypothetical protein
MNTSFGAIGKNVSIQHTKAGTKQQTYILVFGIPQMPIYTGTKETR